jgi:hypothetical protein
MSDRDFLSFLVDETLKLQKSGEVELSSLERKLGDYSLSFLKGVFIPQTQMLRFESPKGKLDVPMNWGIFDFEQSGTVLDSEHDTDGFFSVMRSAWDTPIEQLAIIHADGFCFLVGFRTGEVHHLHDLLNPQEWLKSA